MRNEYSLGCVSFPQNSTQKAGSTDNDVRAGSSLRDTVDGAKRGTSKIYVGTVAADDVQAAVASNSRCSKMFIPGVSVWSENFEQIGGKSVQWSDC